MKLNFADIAKKHQKGLQFWKHLCEAKKCTHCAKKFPEGLIIPHPAQEVSLLKMLRGDYLFHLHETHGLPPEFAYDMISSCLKN